MNKRGANPPSGGVDYTTSKGQNSSAWQQTHEAYQRITYEGFLKGTRYDAGLCQTNSTRVVGGGSRSWSLFESESVIDLIHQGLSVRAGSSTSHINASTDEVSERRM